SSCAADSDNNVYFVGITTVEDAIATPGSFQPNHGAPGGFLVIQGLLVKFDPNGQRLWGTYYGGTASDQLSSCTVDEDDNIYVAGASSSIGMATVGSFQDTKGISSNAILAKFDGSGTRLWATYYGGNSASSG